MSNDQKLKVVIADDSEEALYALEDLLKSRGYTVFAASSGRAAFSLAQEHGPDVIVSDLVMPGGDGLELARLIKADPELRYTPVVLVTSKDNLEDVIVGFENGADDYIKKPYRPEELIARMHAAIRTRSLYQELKSTSDQNRRLKSQLGERFSFQNIVGKSGPMKEVFDLIEKVADSHVPVLITGESGTGKELIASAIHYQSARKTQPFIIQNCAAFSEQILESELFGHVKGAFTGAIRDKEGLFEAANGGTFFLDEIGEMSPTLQAKLLRVLQDGSYTPVGSTKQRKADVRIVAATNRNLPEMIKKGQFREDLYYRINVINLRLPPLRERKSDIPLLIERFMQLAAGRSSSAQKRLNPALLQLLCDYDWPGNIRELENEVERLWLMSGKDAEITPLHASPILKSNATTVSAAATGDLKQAVEKLERDMILASLKKNNGNKSEVARELGISRSNLIAKVQSYGLEDPS